MYKGSWFLYLFIFITVISCDQEKKYHDDKVVVASDNDKIASVLQFQKELNEEYKDPETSPLKDKHRKTFEGLDFFPPDTSYVVTASFERTPDAVPFMLETTTDRKTPEVVYGIAHFDLNGKTHQLELYQSLDPVEKMKSKNRLFLPFLDETNGNETYGGGRYIDLAIPEGDLFVIDFNKAYNPYCVYNKKYSCPLVPRQNYLRTSVRAGVKDFAEN